MLKLTLSHILNEDIVGIQQINDSAKLIEPQNLDPKTLQEVDLIGIPDNALILSASGMSSSLFRENDSFCDCHTPSKYRKKCDYIVLTEFDHNNYIIYIEMKTSPRTQKYIPQLWCGRCFMEYLLFAISNLDNIQPSSNFIHRYVKFYRIPEDKDSTKLTDDEYKKPPKIKTFNDQPGKAYLCCVTAGIPISIRDLIYEYNH